MSFAEGVTTSQQPYKYNGKELDTERGLNLYDYCARLMDPVLGRFSTMDPLAEKYYWDSPYVYCGNNPINAIDPNGENWYINRNGNYYWQEGEKEKEGYDNVGNTVSIQLGENSYLNAYQNGGIISNKAANAFDLISQSGTLQKKFLGERSPLSENSKSELFNALVGNENNKLGQVAGKALLTVEAVASGAGLLDAVGRAGIGLLSRGSAKAGSRAFFSGAGTEARAIEEGFQTLGQTRAGKNLQNLTTSRNIPWSEAEPMWQRLSATWAKGVPNGSSVSVFLNNPRAGAVWFQTELPILQSKGINLIYK